MALAIPTSPRGPHESARNFCDVQPEHPDCKTGRVEDYSSFSTVAEATPAIPSQTQFHQKLGIRWRAATALEIERVADKAERVLLDGGSARYIDVVISTNEGRDDLEHTYCGLINAKNAWGAYGGYIRFVLSPGRVFKLDSPENKRFISRACQ